MPGPHDHTGGSAQVHWGIALSWDDSRCRAPISSAHSTGYTESTGRRSRSIHIGDMSKMQHATEPQGHRLFVIQPAEYESLFAGAAADGRQVLMGLDGVAVLAVFFDDGGTLTATERRPIPAAAASTSSLTTFTWEFRQEAARVLTAWQEQIGFTA